MSDRGDFHLKTRLQQMDSYVRWVVFGIVVVSLIGVLLSLVGMGIIGVGAVGSQNAALDIVPSTNEHSTLEYDNQEVIVLNTGQRHDFKKTGRQISTLQFNNADTSTISTSIVDWAEPPPSEVVEDTEFSVTLEGEGHDELCLVDEGIIDDAIECAPVDGEFTETFTVDVEDDLDNEQSTLYAGVDDDNPFGYIPADETSYETVDVIPDPVYWEGHPPTEVVENSTFSVQVSGQRKGEVCLVQQGKDAASPIGCQAVDSEFTVTFPVDVEGDLDNQNATLYAEVNGGEYTTNSVAVHIKDEPRLIVEIISSLISMLLIVLIVGALGVFIGAYFDVIEPPSLRDITVAILPSTGNFSGKTEIIDKYNHYNDVLDIDLSLTADEIQNIRNPDSIPQRLNVKQREESWRRINDATDVYDEYISFLQKDSIKIDSQAFQQLLASFTPHIVTDRSLDSIYEYEETKELLLSTLEFVEWTHQNEPSTVFNATEAYWQLVPEIPSTIDELRDQSTKIEQRQEVLVDFTEQLSTLDSLLATGCTSLIEGHRELIDKQLSEIRTREDTDNFERTVTQLEVLCDIYKEHSQQLDSPQTEMIYILTETAIQNPERSDTALAAYLTLHELQKSESAQFDKELDRIEETLSSEIHAEQLQTDTIETLQELLEQVYDLVEFLNCNSSHPLVDEIEWQEEIRKALAEQYPKRLQPYTKQVDRMEETFWEKSDLYSFDWQEFEHLVGTLFEAEGYNVEVTDGSRDLGVDVWTENDEQKIAVQVKQFGDGNRVGREPLQKLASTLAKGTADKIVVVTSSSFTKTAEDYARDFGPEIELVNGEELIRRLIQAEVPPPP